METMHEKLAKLETAKQTFSPCDLDLLVHCLSICAQVTAPGDGLVRNEQIETETGTTETEKLSNKDASVELRQELQTMMIPCSREETLLMLSVLQSYLSLTSPVHTGVSLSDLVDSPTVDRNLVWN